VDWSFAQLDLSSCSCLKPSTLVRVLDHTRMLLKLDVSGCSLTNAFVCSLPSSVPHLLVLRLRGVPDVEIRAWRQLIPGISVSATPNSWEEEIAADRAR
jgi:hypothetical protein